MLLVLLPLLAIEAVQMVQTQVAPTPAIPTATVLPLPSFELQRSTNIGVIVTGIISALISTVGGFILRYSRRQRLERQSLLPPLSINHVASAERKQPVRTAETDAKDLQNLIRRHRELRDQDNQRAIVKNNTSNSSVANNGAGQNNSIIASSNHGGAAFLNGRVNPPSSLSRQPVPKTASAATKNPRTSAQGDGDLAERLPQELNMPRIDSFGASIIGGVSRNVPLSVNTTSSPSTMMRLMTIPPQQQNGFINYNNNIEMYGGTVVDDAVLVMNGCGDGNVNNTIVDNAVLMGSTAVSQQNNQTIVDDAQLIVHRDNINSQKTIIDDAVLVAAAENETIIDNAVLMNGAQRM